MRPNVGRERVRFFIFQRGWEALNVMNLPGVSDKQGQTRFSAIKQAEMNMKRTRNWSKEKFPPGRPRWPAGLNSGELSYFVDT